MSSTSPQIDQSWLNVLHEEFNKSYFNNLRSKLLEEKKQFSIYPPGSRIFAAFNTTTFEEVKVVIIGQDPYHGPGQANGLSFSVARGINPPPSLKNIYKELASDLGFEIPDHGDLTAWAEQGVLMLNAFLTVRHRDPASHRKIGWENFTDEVIRQLSLRRYGLVFLLWGNFARSKKELIDTSKHHVLEAPHPSPYSANNGFFGCRHFSKTNELLAAQSMKQINWQL